jgi:hypothetical protein
VDSKKCNEGNYVGIKIYMCHTNNSLKRKHGEKGERRPWKIGGKKAEITEYKN